MARPRVVVQRASDHLPEYNVNLAQGLRDTWNRHAICYQVTICFRDKVIGGIPKQPQLVDIWLKSQAGISQDVHRKRLALKTIRQIRGEDVKQVDLMTDDEVYRAIQELCDAEAGVVGNGFKRDPQIGLYLESRQVKAMLREAVNIAFAGARWGITQKGPNSWFREHVFVDPDRIPLGVSEPTGELDFVGHVEDRYGPRSILQRVEYVERPSITFYVSHLRLPNEVEPVLTVSEWLVIWQTCQEIGLGAMRSQGFGRFDVLEFVRVDPETVLKVRTMV